MKIKNLFKFLNITIALILLGSAVYAQTYNYTLNWTNYRSLLGGWPQVPLPIQWSKLTEIQPQ